MRQKKIRGWKNKEIARLSRELDCAKHRLNAVDNAHAAVAEWKERLYCSVRGNVYSDEAPLIYEGRISSMGWRVAAYHNAPSLYTLETMMEHLNEAQKAELLKQLLDVLPLTPADLKRLGYILVGLESA